MMIVGLEFTEPVTKESYGMERRELGTDGCKGIGHRLYDVGKESGRH